MKLLITGGCGFLGSNLAAYGIQNGYMVTVFDNLSRTGSVKNLEWLNTFGDFKFVHGDIRNRNDVEYLIRDNGYDAIFHLAGQVAMTSSIINPYRDFETNVTGSINVLDTVRKYSKDTCIFYSSTNKVYGDLEQYHYQEMPTRYVCTDYPNGFDERVPLDFHSPYGCSKGSADQYMLDYHRIFGLKTVVFRHSSMYGSRQYATTDQGWIGWFCQKAIEKSRNQHATPFTISGNGKQVRDILHANDMVDLYFKALDNIRTVAGDAYNIGGTMQHSLSLLELFQLLNQILDVKLEYKMLPWRESDQKVFVADTKKINSKIDWLPKISAVDGVTRMVKWLNSTVV